MVLDGFWWHRHRWTLIFAALAIAAGSVLGLASTVVVALPPHQGGRPEFYIELFFAAIVVVVVLPLLFTRVRVGLPILLAVLAFLPSRSGMQWRYQGYAGVTAADLTILLGVIVLLVHTKVVRKERLQPIVVRTPLWIWLVVGVLGTLLAIAHGVSWINYVPELKGFFYFILATVLCVNVVRSRQMLWAVTGIVVVSAIPTVYAGVRQAVTGEGALVSYLPNGQTINRVSGGNGLVNQFAYYMLIAFFLSLALALASRRRAVRLFFYGCTLLFLVTIGLTYTRGAWIAGIVGLLVLAVLGGRRVLAGLVVAVVVAYFLIPSTIWARVDFSDNSVAERVTFTNTALATLRVYPLTGAGWGANFSLIGGELVPDFNPGSIPFWHDDYLIVATQVGLPGLAVFIWIWLALAVAVIRARRRAPPGPLRTYLFVMTAALAAMLTQPLTDMFFWRDDSGPLVWLVVGLICSAINLVDDERRGDPHPRPLSRARERGDTLTPNPSPVRGRGETTLTPIPWLTGSPDPSRGSAGLARAPGARERGEDTLLTSPTAWNPTPSLRAPEKGVEGREGVHAP